MRCLIIPLLILFSTGVFAQCRTFRIGSKGDTLDCVDMKGMKQGKWLIRVGPLRGEPGYEEEGQFIDGKREGVWRRFNLMGDPVAFEGYKWGLKHGLSRYFTLEGIEHDESWRAMTPGKLYDTIDVQDLKDPNRYDKVIVKNDGGSLRHGTWKFYNPRSGALIKTEKYILDKLQEPGSDDVTRTIIRPANTVADSTKAKAAVPAKPKPKEVLDFEKKNAGKKKIKVREGRTGG